MGLGGVEGGVFFEETTSFSVSWTGQETRVNVKLSNVPLEEDHCFVLGSLEVIHYKASYLLGFVLE